VWKIRKVNEYRCEKEPQIMDQPKNMEEKKLERASSLTNMVYKILERIQSIILIHCIYIKD